MKNLFITLICTLVFSNNLAAQNAHFITSGTITFEKKVNMFALLKRNITKDNQSYMQAAFDQYQKNQPQFKTLKSNLSFSKDKSLYVPEAPVLVPGASNLYADHPSVTQNNIVFNDLSSNSSIIQKNVFEELFLLKDTTRKINWKITTETRDVAGFTCRRANAIIMDSVYVVAFYTDEIAVPSGPEAFSGLPGMILGVALPYENVTWFATTVSEKTLAPTALAPPTKGKAATAKSLRSTLDEALKSWGDYAKEYFRAFLF